MLSPLFFKGLVVVVFPRTNTSRARHPVKVVFSFQAQAAEGTTFRRANRAVCCLHRRRGMLFLFGFWGNLPDGFATLESVI